MPAKSYPVCEDNKVKTLPHTIVAGPDALRSHCGLRTVEQSLHPRRCCVVLFFSSMRVSGTTHGSSHQQNSQLPSMNAHPQGGVHDPLYDIASAAVVAAAHGHSQLGQHLLSINCHLAIGFTLQAICAWPP